jgi:hypothetical protein
MHQPVRATSRSPSPRATTSSVRLGTRLAIRTDPGVFAAHPCVNPKSNSLGGNLLRLFQQFTYIRQSVSWKQRLLEIVHGG